MQLVDEHDAFTGATSQIRLRKESPPFEHMAASEVDVAFLVAS